MRPADVCHAEIIILQVGEADIHQDFTQAVVHGIQDEAFGERTVGGTHLQQLSGAGRSGASRRGSGTGEQLSRELKSGSSFERRAVEAERCVFVPLWGELWPAGCTDGAEVQHASLSNGSDPPGLQNYGKLTGCG